MATHATDAHDAPHSHAKTYTFIWIVLLLGTLLTVVTAKADLGGAALPVALLIASTKAILVLLYFMHLNEATGPIRVVAGDVVPLHRADVELPARRLRHPLPRTEPRGQPAQRPAQAAPAAPAGGGAGQSADRHHALSLARAGTEARGARRSGPPAPSLPSPTRGGWRRGRRLWSREMTAWTHASLPDDRPRGGQRLIRRTPGDVRASTANGLIAAHYPVLLEADRETTIVSHFGRPDEQLHDLGQKKTC